MLILETIKGKIKNLWQKLEALQSVIIFMAILFAANFVWKLSISGDESDEQVFLFNHWDISASFNFMTAHIAHMVRSVILFFNIPIHWHCDIDVCFSNHHRVIVVWGCTAIKQSFIFLCIMLFTPGPWKHKLWYIPFGLFLVYLFNIFRITMIAFSVENYREYFNILHEGVFKYLFYGFIFLIWVFWNEKFNEKSKKKEKTDAESHQ